MPVLPLEPFVHPVDLFESARKASDVAEPWWVLHTRPRAEKALARHLLQKDISFFLPLFQRERPFRGRTVTSYLPLFAGYLFLRGDHQARLQALITNTVAQTLVVKAQQELHSDLTRVFQLMASGVPMAPEDRIRPGTLIQITAGPLAGLEGKVIRRARRLRLVVEVQFLQRGASVEIDSWMIEPS